MTGAWRVSGYDTDPDAASNLLGVVPNFLPLDVVLRRDGAASGAGRLGTWSAADGVLTLRLTDRAGTISRFTLSVDRSGRAASAGMTRVGQHGPSG